MLKLINQFLRENARKRLLRGFWAEANANLEHYYVCFQISRLRVFEMAAWEKAKDSYSFPDAVRLYADRLHTYNQVYKTFKDYEIWYNDINNKNQENGRVLHQKKQDVQAQFNGLENVIKAGIQSIQDEFLKLKIITPNDIRVPEPV